MAAGWHLAPALALLRLEINARWPGRDKASDGSVGDTSHSARKSDHNPDWSAGGVVRALDVDEDGPDMALLLRVLRADPRVNYVIYEGRIYQAIHRMESRRYTGANAHKLHIHVSIKPGQEHNLTPWLPAVPTPPQQRAEDIMTSRAELQQDLAGMESRLMQALTGAAAAQGRPAAVFRLAGTAASYLDLGTCRRHVTAELHAAIGQPPVHQLPITDGFWQLPVVGIPGELYRTPAVVHAYAFLGSARRWITAEDYAAFAPSTPLITELPADHPFWWLPTTGPTPEDKP